MVRNACYNRAVLFEFRSCARSYRMLWRRPDFSGRENMDATIRERESVADKDVADAAHYVKYSFAAYGYLLFMLSSPIYSYVFPSATRYIHSESMPSIWHYYKGLVWWGGVGGNCFPQCHPDLSRLIYNPLQCLIHPILHE